MTKLETSRLVLRHMTSGDFAALCEILCDSAAMYAYEGAFSESEAREWLERNLERYRRDGFGLWAVVLKAGNKMIGQAGLTLQSLHGRQVPEIGYLFNRAYWGNGYAIESALACKELAFNGFGFKEVFSIVRDTNISSMNVAIRNGMLVRDRIIKHYRGAEMPHLVFSARDAFNPRTEISKTI